MFFNCSNTQLFLITSFANFRLLHKITLMFILMNYKINIMNDAINISRTTENLIFKSNI